MNIIWSWRGRNNPTAKKLGRKLAKRAFYRPRLERLEDRLTPAVHDWTGLGADNLWSNPVNWTNGAPSSDVSGDVDLLFHTNLLNTAKLVTQNDLVNLVVDSITFTGVAGTFGFNTTYANGGTSTSGYTINGNAITFDVGGPNQDFCVSPRFVGKLLRRR